MYSQTLSISFPLYQNVFIPRLSCSSFFFKAILMMNVETVQPSPSAKVKSPASIEVVWFVCHQQRETWHVCGRICTCILVLKHSPMIYLVCAQGGVTIQGQLAQEKLKLTYNANQICSHRIGSITRIITLARSSYSLSL